MTNEEIKAFAERHNCTFHVHEGEEFDGEIRHTKRRFWFKIADVTERQLGHQMDHMTRDIMRDNGLASFKGGKWEFYAPIGIPCS